MYLLLLSGFSNYNNRTIRKAATPDLYASIAEGHWYIMKGDSSGLLPINFKPNDGVSTTQIINDDLTSEFGHEPDYLIAFDNADTSTECVVSRWFILEIRQTRKGQRELILRRDLIADYYEELKTADVFVERGLCNNNDPLIFNDEGMMLNKIKKSETLIKDDTRTAWIVGYMDGGSSKQTISITAAPPSDYYTTSEISTITGMSVQNVEDLLSGQPVNVANGWGFCFVNGNWSGYYELIKFSSGFSFANEESYTMGRVSQISTLTRLNSQDGTLRMAKVRLGNKFVNAKSAILSQFESETYGDGGASITATQEELDRLMNITKPIYYSGRYYVIKNQTSLSQQEAMTASALNLTGAVATQISSWSSDYGYPYEPDGQWKAVAYYSPVLLQVEELATTTASVGIGGGSVKDVENRPYKMFCMPTDDFYILQGGVIVSKNQKQYTKRVAAEIMRDKANPLGIHDLQLLPYCPCRHLLKQNYVGGVLDTTYIDLSGYAEGTDYEQIKDGNNNVIGWVFYCESDSWSVINDTRFPIDTSSKYDSNAKLLRLCSPNYQGSFDFNAAKNGIVRGFVINFTYKPYTPFIRVAPLFSGLYGAEFNDQRGLICGGNFSLMKLSDPWEQYELNNKNYQNIFNREIQTLDLSQSLQMRDAIIGASVGTLQGGVAGAQTGAMVGGGWGAAAGAVLGAGISGLGGAIDVNTLARLQKDQRSLQVDKFNYALGNIKALPNTLTKVDAFDISSKIFPFIEEYGPTEEEKALFLERMRLQSYTLMRIEKLGNQMTEDAPTDITLLHYVKGQLIRTNNEDLRVDSHQWDEIYAELSKGVYI